MKMCEATINNYGEKNGGFNMDIKYVDHTLECKKCKRKLKQNGAF